MAKIFATLLKGLRILWHAIIGIFSIAIAAAIIFFFLLVFMQSETIAAINFIIGLFGG